MFIGLIISSLLLSGCKNTELSLKGANLYYTRSGNSVILNGDYIVVVENGLKIIDLNTKEVVKDIGLQGNYPFGYDMDDTKVVWSDFASKDENSKDPGYDETANKDIYLYDIKTDKETPIATGPLQECKPTIYGNYIAWEDRNNEGFAAEIYLYDINKNKKTRITKDKYDQRDPKLFDKYLVWMDERRGTSTNDVVINGKKPNSDIFLYDIESKKEYLMTGDEPQIMPSISGNYIAYITSRQINAEINVIKYR